MKFGVFSVSMPEYTVEETVNILKELGYNGVEWRVTEIDPEAMAGAFGENLTDEQRFEYRYWLDNKSTLDVNNIMEEAKRVKAICDEAGISIFGLSTYLNTDKYDELVEVYRAAQATDIPMVRVGLVNLESSFEKEKRHVRDLNQKMRSELERLVDLSKETGVKTVIEMHMGTLIASPSAAYNMLKGLDPKYIGVIVDPGNMAKEGYEEYRKAFELLGDYIAHVHMKNGRYIEKEERNAVGAKTWDYVWTPLKDGQADLLRVFEVMKELGYDHTVSVEDFSNEQDTYEKLKDNLAYLKTCYDFVRQ